MKTLRLFVADNVSAAESIPLYLILKCKIPIYRLYFFSSSILHRVRSANKFQRHYEIIIIIRTAFITIDESNFLYILFCFSPCYNTERTLNTKIIKIIKTTIKHTLRGMLNRYYFYAKVIYDFPWHRMLFFPHYVHSLCRIHSLSHIFSLTFAFIYRLFFLSCVFSLCHLRFRSYSHSVFDYNFSVCCYAFIVVVVFFSFSYFFVPLLFQCWHGFWVSVYIGKTHYVCFCYRRSTVLFLFIPSCGMSNLYMNIEHSPVSLFAKAKFSQILLRDIYTECFILWFCFWNLCFHPTFTCLNFLMCFFRVPWRISHFDFLILMEIVIRSFITIKIEFMILKSKKNPHRNRNYCLWWLECAFFIDIVYVFPAKWQNQSYSMILIHFIAFFHLTICHSRRCKMNHSAMALSSNTIKNRQTDTIFDTVTPLSGKRSIIRLIF